jgi:Xaa-Pro dipeptidase
MEITMTLKTQISLSELVRRQENIREVMMELNLDGVCIFSPMRNFYFSGFHHLATERPVALVIPAQGNMALMVPSLEEENIPERTPHIKEIKAYREYPGQKHPMMYLKDLLIEKGLLGKRLGIDSDGWGGGWGYRGPSLAEISPKTELINIRDVIDKMRVIKSSEELDLIRISAYFANTIHGLLMRNIEIGQTEIEICLRTNLEMARFETSSYGETWEPLSGSGTSIGITSGWKTARNHRATGARKIRQGDVILTEAAPSVGGYMCELERMLIVGKPTEKHKLYFDLEIKAQDVAFNAIRPGRKCSDVERDVNKFLEENGILQLTRTHIGHSIGIDPHELPFLDEGDDSLIQPGMVFCVEPCLFIPGFAGFRHSDTVMVMQDSIERITTFPRDLNSLTILV